MDISAREVKERITAGETGFVLIDVRESYEREEFNIGGLHIPLGEFMSQISDLEEYTDDEVIIYCRSGRRSAMAQSLLQQQGFSNVKNLEGGMVAYQEA
jgi:rhodanese-related sulfurtransferase